MQETRVRSLGWEDPLEEEMATHSSVLAWRIRGQRSLAGYSPRGRKESDTTEAAGRPDTQDMDTHGDLLARLQVSTRAETT